jgi:hypothetical protein
MKRLSQPMLSLLAVAFLSVAAAWATLHSPTVFLIQQILLGLSVGVSALLLFLASQLRQLRRQPGDLSLRGVVIQSCCS